MDETTQVSILFQTAEEKPALTLLECVECWREIQPGGKFILNTLLYLYMREVRAIQAVMCPRCDADWVVVLRATYRQKQKHCTRCYGGLQLAAGRVKQLGFLTEDEERKLDRWFLKPLTA